MEVINERPRYGYDVEVVMAQIYLEDLMSKMKFVNHVPELCNWSGV